MMKRILIVVILLAIPACFGQTQTAKVRTYYVAADEVDWDYAPGGVNKMMGMQFEGYSTVFTERGPHRIGTSPGVGAHGNSWPDPASRGR